MKSYALRRVATSYSRMRLPHRVAFSNVFAKNKKHRGKRMRTRHVTSQIYSDKNHRLFLSLLSLVRTMSCQSDQGENSTGSQTSQENKK